jgi:hypothetical protein
VLNAKNYEVWPSNWEILFDVVGDLCGFGRAGMWICQTGSCEGQKYRLIDVERFNALKVQQK